MYQDENNWNEVVLRSSSSKHVREGSDADARVWQRPSPAARFQDPELPRGASALSAERVSSDCTATQTARWPQAVNNYINVTESSSAARAADLQSREAGGERKKKRNHTAEKPYPPKNTI